MTEAYYIGFPEAVRKQTPAASVLTLRLRSPSSSLSSLSPLQFVCTSIFESWTFSCPFLSKKSILVKRVHALLASHFCYRAKALLNEVLRFLCSPQEAPKGNTKGLGMAQSGEDLAVVQNVSGEVAAQLEARFDLSRTWLRSTRHTQVLIQHRHRGRTESWRGLRVHI